MPKQEKLLPFAREVIDVPVTEELGESFLAYSLSVITSRAIPDIKDGLKPVQRRILYSMREMRLYPDRPHRKCAHVVGDVMAKFHPHGDAAIYDTLVRLGQDFAKQVTVIDPQGNFGSLDDPPAAYRYTECRLTSAALDLLGEIDEETVEWRPTYDGETEEPVYLPALLPNLLVNGTSGIAVGMATSMPTHNLGEVYEAIKLVMTKRRPKPTVTELMEVIPGPDFPSGGLIINEGIVDAFETGRGSIRVRAKADIVKITRSRKGLEITELPYLVGVERVITKLKQLRESGKISEISDVKNLSDRKSGLKLLIECKAGIRPEILLEKLYRLTPLEETFGVNNVVLINGVPTTVGLYDLCIHYIDHRLDVIVKRTEFRLRKAEARKHIIEGLIIAIDNIDKVVSIIRSSKDSGHARAELMKQLKLSEVQAEHILELKLRRLTALAYDELIEEIQELKITIAELKKILGSEQRRRTMVLKELKEIVDRYAVPRRSKLINPDDIGSIEELESEAIAEIADTPCVVSLTASGLIGREPKGNSGNHSSSKHDVIKSTVITSLPKYVYGITSKGRLLRALAADITEVGGRTRGKTVSEHLPTEKGEQVINIFTDEGENILLVNNAGKAKRIERKSLTEVKPGRPVMKIAQNEELIAAFESPDGSEVVFVSSDAQTLRTTTDSISVQGPGAKGVAAMSLKGNAKLISAGLAEDSSVIVVTTDQGTAKSTSVDEIPTKGRGAGGVRLTKFNSEHRIEYAWIGNPDRAICIVGQTDSPTKPDNKPMPLQLRTTKRDSACKDTKQRILGVGSLRW